jgi:tetratricopeptide (TPR) repeat protein
MNIFVKYFTFLPILIKYLKGGILFNERKYSLALQKFSSCLDHPSFQNELFYSYYGQTLCALGRLDEGHKYLIKACKIYEKEGWVFESDYVKQLSQNSLSALEHILNHTNNTEGTEYLQNLLKEKEK